MKKKLFFWKDYYPTKTKVWRKRSDSWTPEDRKAVRYYYEDRPNAHQMDNGEEIPAIPLENVFTQSDGTNFFEVAEVEDGQYAPVKTDIQKGLEKAAENNELKISDETLEYAAKKIAENGGYVPITPVFEPVEVKKTVINNKDQRLNFWLDHLKERAEKYTITSLIAQNKELIMVVATAIALAIIGWSFGDVSDLASALGNLESSISDNTEKMSELMENLEDVESVDGEPPGN